MNKINNQNGRSMVEILGVLAIIGVLSIGGIAGYTMAMNRYKANQILDMATKLSVGVQAMFSNPSATPKNGTYWKTIGYSLESTFVFEIMKNYTGYYWFPSQKDVDFYVEPSGSVDIVAQGNVYKALKSITGNQDKPIFESTLIGVRIFEAE